MRLIFSSFMSKRTPGNGIPRLSLESVLEIVVDGKIHRVEGKTLQQWILKQRRNVKAREEFSFRGGLRWRTFLLSAMACGC
jgi:hypothetical protein